MKGEKKWETSKKMKQGKKDVRADCFMNRSKSRITGAPRVEENISAP